MPNFEQPVANFVRSVNALNEGKGLGMNAGNASPKYGLRNRVRPSAPDSTNQVTPPRVRYFYRLRWSAATYKRGQLRPVGLDTAEALFPQVRARKTAAAGSALKEAMRPGNRYGYGWLWHV